jgi:hypothetical protein
MAADSKIFSHGGKLAVRIKDIDDDSFLWEHVTPDGGLVLIFSLKNLLLCLCNIVLCAVCGVRCAVYERV